MKGIVIATMLLITPIAAYAQGGGNGGRSEGRFGVSVDRNGLHLRLRVGNPQYLDSVGVKDYGDHATMQNKEYGGHGEY